jgi:hypothetical protein
MRRGAVDERAVRHLEPDGVAAADLVDVRERGEVGRSVARDVDEAVLARHVRALVAAGPFLQRVVVGAVDENHVEPDAADDDPPDRLPGSRSATEACRVLRDGDSLGGKVAVVGPDVPELGELAVERRRERALLPVRVERAERVLPAPHDHCPHEQQCADADQDAARDPCRATHSSAV